MCSGQSDTGSLSGENGQVNLNPELLNVDHHHPLQMPKACFWFSNGCSIGCPKCDGTTRYSWGENCDNDLVIKIGTSIKSDTVQYRGPSIHTDKMDTCGLNYTVRRIELDQEVTCSFCLNCEFEGKCKFFLSGNCLWSVQENSQHRWKSDSNDLSLLALVSSQ